MEVDPNALGNDSLHLYNRIACVLGAEKKVLFASSVFLYYCPLHTHYNIDWKWGSAYLIFITFHVHNIYNKDYEIKKTSESQKVQVRDLIMLI